MLEDELTIVITSDKQLLCEKLTCTTHQQQPISVKHHNKQQNFDKWQVQKPCDNLLFMNRKTINN
jgi:hypothetical protein